MSNTSRRSFVRKLLLAPETALPPVGERTLVCVFLRGAADTLNMVIPQETTSITGCVRRLESIRKPN
jgi:uncharacterized protein (DUF1501 family)